MKKIIFMAPILLLVVYLTAQGAVGEKNEITVESVRKDGILSLISTEALSPGQRTIIVGNKDRILTLIAPLDSVGKRYLARLEGDDFVLRAGMVIVMREEIKIPGRVSVEKKIEIKRVYKRTIVSRVDLREMAYIDDGFFYVGSDTGEPDERPRHLAYRDGFYIDKYEVTNADYLAYVKAGKVAYPRSWGATEIDASKLDYPVLVSYSEAERYSVWAGKLIPSEEEWEKAASSSSVKIPVYGKDGYAEVQRQTQFPWGDQYNPLACVCADFWSSMMGEDLKKKGTVPGTLPVHRQNPSGISFYGLVDASGNLPEWTSSWYQPYPGNTMTHFRFGEQVKVIKGGGWYSSRSALRVSSREYGGIPNLNEDAVAGFRCIKAPTIEDFE
ncbi:MAG TPA: SUMF1/EgtB/PvdO family nonheme iron enzyme [Spirochaetota bacterium]